MKLKIVIFLLYVLCLNASEYAVVSNVLLAKLSPMQIRAVFLKKLTHLNGKHLVPVNLPSSSPLRLSFEKELLKMSKKRLKSYWIKQHYLGNRPPLNMKSQEATLKFTQKVQGAICYVEIENISSKVNVLYSWKGE